MAESISGETNSITALKNATQFLDIGHLCDIEIFCDETSIGSFHKVILAASCSYFKKFLNVASKQWHFQKLDADAVKEVILHLYGESINVKLDNAIKLLKVASLLELKNLVTLCTDVVIKETASHNALKVRDFLMSCDMQDAVSKIDEEIYKNFNEVVTSADYLDVTFEYVNHLTRSDKICVNDESEVFDAIRKWIAHDYSSRRDHIETLFKNVKVPLLQLKFIHKVVDNDPLFNSLDTLQDFVKQSITYILNNETKRDQPLLTKYHFKKRNKVTENDLKVVNQAESKDIPWLMICGGQSSEHKLNTTEFSMNDCTTWQSGPNMPNAKTNFGTVIHAGCIYVLGGQDATGKVTTKCEMYNPMTKQWKRIRNLHEPRANHSAYRVGKQLVISGGVKQNGVKSNETFGLDITEKDSNWSKLSYMFAARSNHFTCYFRNKIYAIGGSDDGSNEAYDFQDKQWNPIAKLKVNRSQAGGAILGNRIYIVGGLNFLDQCESSIEYYNCSNNSWTLLSAKLSVARYGLSAFSDNDKLYISGGRDNTGTVYDTVEKLMINENRWTLIGHLNQARYGHSSSKIFNQNDEAVNAPRSNQEKNKNMAKIAFDKKKKKK